LRAPTRGRSGVTAFNTISPTGFFAEQIEALVDRLVPYKEFLVKLSATGAETMLSITFLGEGYYVDEISLSLLKKLVDLELSLVIDNYAPYRPHA
jgi:hypothetical protein